MHCLRANRQSESYRQIISTRILQHFLCRQIQKGLMNVIDRAPTEPSRLSVTICFGDEIPIWGFCYQKVINNFEKIFDYLPHQISKRHDYRIL